MTLGSIACAACFTFLELYWPPQLDPSAGLDRIASFAGLDMISLIRAMSVASIRFTWIVSISAAVFASIILLVSLIAGLAETFRVNRRLVVLRRDMDEDIAMNIAYWRAAFLRTAIPDRAEAIVSGKASLDGLSELWLDRLTLSKAISPLPILLIAFAGTLALMRHDISGEWEVTLAAGTASAFLIRFAQYLVQSALSVSIATSVRNATLVICALTERQSVKAQTAPEISEPPLPAPVPVPSDIATRIEQLNAFALGKAVASVLMEPLNRLTEAADRFSTAAIGREREINAALAEVRAKIEHSLAESYRHDD